MIVLPQAHATAAPLHHQPKKEIGTRIGSRFASKAGTRKGTGIETRTETGTGKGLTLGEGDGIILGLDLGKGTQNLRMTGANIGIHPVAQMQVRGAAGTDNPADPEKGA